MKKSKKKQNFFLLGWKKLGIIILLGFVSIILHNVISALFNVEEALFFIIAVFLIPIYLIISIIYTLSKRGKKK